MPPCERRKNPVGKYICRCARRVFETRVLSESPVKGSGPSHDWWIFALRILLLLRPRVSLKTCFPVFSVFSCADMEDDLAQIHCRTLGRPKPPRVDLIRQHPIFLSASCSLSARRHPVKLGSAECGKIDRELCMPPRRKLNMSWKLSREESPIRAPIYPSRTAPGIKCIPSPAAPFCSLQNYPRTLSSSLVLFLFTYLLSPSITAVPLVFVQPHTSHDDNLSLHFARAILTFNYFVQRLYHARSRERRNTHLGN